MVFHWSLSDSKSLQVSRTLLGILANLNNTVIWMVSTCPLISKSSSFCTNPLVTVPSAPSTIGITVTFIFHSFFSSLARSWYLFLFLLSFSFTLWLTGTVKFINRQLLIIIIRIRIIIDYPDYNIFENSQNPDTSCGNLRKLAVTQTPVKGD